MKFASLAAACVLSLSTAVSYAIEHATPEQATAMVKKAVAHIKTAGKDKALTDFSSSPEWKSGDLYVMVYDHNGTNLAHGGNAKLVGKNLIELKDADGKLIVKGLLDTAANGKGGWFDYKWPNPVSKVVEAKSTYVENAGDLVVGVGVYK